MKLKVIYTKHDDYQEIEANVFEAQADSCTWSPRGIKIDGEYITFKGEDIFASRDLYKVRVDLLGPDGYEYLALHRGPRQYDYMNRPRDTKRKRFKLKEFLSIAIPITIAIQVCLVCLAAWLMSAA